jgi:hypothetical protein
MTFFITFDNHRNGDYAPYVYVSTDWGKTARSIAANLPTGGPNYVHVIRQDPVNRNLLYVGTDVGAYVSLNMGRSWQRFMGGLPTVPVHDLKVHPREHELIAATHGRSFWIVDVAPLQQLSDSVVAADAYLFAPTTAQQWGEPPFEGQSTGQMYFQAQGAPYGASILYRLTSKVEGQVKVEIRDVRGDVIRTLNGPGLPGLHRVIWDFRGKAPAAAALSPSQKRDSIIAARRADVVFDSLGKAGLDSAALGRFRRLLASGDMGQLFAAFGGGGGGGGFSGAGWNPRPGEQSSGGRGGGAAQAAASAAGITDPNQAFQIIQLLNPRGGFGGGGGGFGFGGPQAPIVSPGEYLVTTTVNGKTLKQVLKVERASGSGTISAFFQEQ